jgi:hypothetical protein
VAGLAQFLHTTPQALVDWFDEVGVPVLAAAATRLVPAELADRAIGLDVAEVALEIARNEAEMRRREFRPDGSRKTVEEYAAEVDARAQAALKEFSESGGR